MAVGEDDHGGASQASDDVGCYAAFAHISMLHVVVIDTNCASGRLLHAQRDNEVEFEVDDC